MSTATMTLSFSEYQALLDDKKKLVEEAADLQRQLTAAKLEDPSGRLAPVLAFARDCLTVTRYAVANLAPELSVGWPFVELRRIATALPSLPDATINDRDMAIDLHAFARDCEAHETRRANAPKAVKLTAAEIAAEQERLKDDPIAQMAMDRMKARALPE